ncbi:hypothetical protein TVAG_160170 [Trichomonas vaginalis G3]|uniref:Uncharacterized protein n=1 Tax=Trichomonas vaginalis (strain ATCC PRA-98 / G3) TaxID=412133 RepID=A2DUV9_TRIV3|nr:hypothetical protein TVAGG3_0259230 [Trichomonas vaginalis G3]EAY15844.1 hypothetical protein TVAG_160170 [Trichomonas vaginalis G3]KAI5524987.1 hypothetical protein TVAGG3_0259230 [Trichomonas vaginalis G3]|eukprot:XP_001328067.1 hypothetical protein [Trichomonas vaginalis G3]
MKRDLFKKETDDPENFLMKVHLKFQGPSYKNVLEARDAIQFDLKLKKLLMDYLKRNVSIKENLNVVTNFDLMSETTKFNYITLLCLLRMNVPEEFLQTETLKQLYYSYTLPPKLPIINEAAVEINQQKQQENPPEIQSAPFTSEFFAEVENIFVKYPQFAEKIISEKFDSSGVKQFHDTIKIFFSCDRTAEAVTAVVRFYILPYIKNLKNLANRLVVEPLMSVSQWYPKVIVSEVFQPVLFDPNSTVYQFQIIQRLFEAKSIQSLTLPGVFEGRPPSLEGPLSDEALKWLVNIIPKTPQLQNSEQETVLLHIKMQMDHQKKDAQRAFMLFLKGQHLEGQNKEIATQMIENLPEVLKSRALQMI